MLYIYYSIVFIQCHSQLISVSVAASSGINVATQGSITRNDSRFIQIHMQHIYSVGRARHASGTGEKTAEVRSVMVLHGDATDRQTVSLGSKDSCSPRPKNSEHILKLPAHKVNNISTTPNTAYSPFLYGIAYNEQLQQPCLRRVDTRASPRLRSSVSFPFYLNPQTPMEPRSQ